MVNQNYTPQAENYFVQKPQYVMPTKNSAIVQFRDGTMYVTRFSVAHSISTSDHLWKGL